MVSRLRLGCTVLSLCFLAVAGCDDAGSDEEGADTGADSDTIPVEYFPIIFGPYYLASTSYHSNLEYDAGPEDILTEALPCWGNANCWRCHEGVDLVGGLDPPPSDCVVCHGLAGATVQPANHRAYEDQLRECDECHSPLHKLHDSSTNLFSWDACETCHPLHPPQ